MWPRDNRPVNLHPLFLKMGHPAFWKKQAENNRDILYSKREETRLPLLFLNYNDLGFFALCFFQKAGCPIFKNRGCRLTGRLSNFDWIFSIQIAKCEYECKHPKLDGDFDIWCQLEHFEYEMNQTLLEYLTKNNRNECSKVVNSSTSCLVATPQV